MEFDTVILLAMTAGAYCWYVSFGILEARKEIKALEQEEVERQRRDARVDKLFGR